MRFHPKFHPGVQYAKMRHLPSGRIAHQSVARAGRLERPTSGLEVLNSYPPILHTTPTILHSTAPKANTRTPVHAHVCRFIPSRFPSWIGGASW